MRQEDVVGKTLLVDRFLVFVGTQSDKNLNSINYNSIDYIFVKYLP